MRRLICDGTGDGLTDPPRCIGRELITTAVFEFVHGLHQADVTFLNKIKELQAAVACISWRWKSPNAGLLRPFLFWPDVLLFRPFGPAARCGGIQ